MPLVIKNNSSTTISSNYIHLFMITFWDLTCHIPVSVFASCYLQEIRDSFV